MKIDLSDVSEQLPIPKVGKSGTSKYQGVYFRKGNLTNPWKAQIRIDGKDCHIGYYDNQEDAAGDYAKAVFKYAPEKLKALDLSDVPAQLPIPKEVGKSGTSKYQGVSLHNATQKWRATISNNGKQYHIGIYDNQEDAAKDYARALFKFTKGKTEVVHQQKQSTENDESAVSRYGNSNGLDDEDDDTASNEVGGEDFNDGEDNDYGDEEDIPTQSSADDDNRMNNNNSNNNNKESRVEILWIRDSARPTAPDSSGNNSSNDSPNAYEVDDDYVEVPSNVSGAGAGGGEFSVSELMRTPIDNAAAELGLQLETQKKENAFCGRKLTG